MHAVVSETLVIVPESRAMPKLCQQPERTITSGLPTIHESDVIWHCERYGDVTPTTRAVPEPRGMRKREVRSPSTPHEVYRFARQAATTLLLLFCAAIRSPREPLLKRVAAVPKPQSARLCRACCSGSVWDTPAPPNCAGTDRSRPERHLRQPGWKRL